MLRRGDDRAVSALVGAVLLLGIFVVALSMYQLNVVPNENYEVEVNHNERVTGDMVELRNAIGNAASDGGARGVSMTLGTQYNTRTFTVNPSSPTGTIQTVEPEENIIIENAEIDDAIIDDLLDKELETKFVRYEPHYNEYTGAPDTIIEHTLLYNQFRDGNVTLEDQTLIRDKQINLIVVDGDLSRTESGTVSVDVETLGGPGSATLESDESNATITLPTNSPERWNDSVGESFSEGQSSAKVLEASEGSVTIELYEEETFDLRIAKVRVGEGGERDDRYDGDPRSTAPVNDSTRGPLVTDADTDPSEIEQGESFTLSADMSTIGSDEIRSGTPIVGGEWESNRTTGFNEEERTFSVEGDPATLEDVKLDGEISTDISTDEDWELGTHELTFYGQDATGRVSSGSDVGTTTIKLVGGADEPEGPFGVFVEAEDNTNNDIVNSTFTVTGDQDNYEFSVYTDETGTGTETDVLELTIDEGDTLALAEPIPHNDDIDLLDPDTYEELDDNDEDLLSDISQDLSSDSEVQDLENEGTVSLETPTIREQSP